MYTYTFIQMYGDSLEGLEVITLDLIDDLIAELSHTSRDGSCDVLPSLSKCTAGIISSIVSSEGGPRPMSDQSIIIK